MALDADRHYRAKAIVLDGLYDLFVEDVEECLNFGFFLPLHQPVRHATEAVAVECRVVKPLEVRMFADQVVELNYQVILSHARHDEVWRMSWL